MDVERSYDELLATAKLLSAGGQNRQAAETALRASEFAPSLADQAAAQRQAATYFGLASEPQLRVKYALTASETFASAASVEQAEPGKRVDLRYRAFDSSSVSDDYEAVAKRAHELVDAMK